MESFASWRLMAAEWRRKKDDWRRHFKERWVKKWSKFKKCTHMTSIYSLSVTRNWRKIWISIEISLEFMEPNFGAKTSLIIISELQLWFSPLIQDQFQDSPLIVLRCHEACKAWRTCTKYDHMMWQWGVASKCSPPPQNFNWIGLLPIQLNLFSNTHIKYSLNACEITKLPLIQKLV